MRVHVFAGAAMGFFCVFNLFGATITVTTPDNASPAGDSQTSLMEAIVAAKAGDTIAFNIPGPGPHTILTPLGGYPFITVNGLTIDGYTQPGSSPNHQSFAGTNNAQIQIILDSTGEETGDSPYPEKPELVLSTSTRMLTPEGEDISGYGDSENGVLAFIGAENIRIRGLCFLARHPTGETEDPSIYSIALAKGCKNVKVQGCRFGLHPDNQTISGASTAVSAYRYRENVGGVNVDTFSDGLVFGTDGDGVSDLEEGNISIGMEIALALELPGARVSGNRFNVFPDGKTFLDVFQYASDRSLSSVESFENGRGRKNTLVGTDGDGVSDLDERNVFAPSLYELIFEFYGGNPATNIVIAGNFFGVGVDGETEYPFPPLGTAPSFVGISDAGSVRIGTNGDGVSDDIEANYIYGINGDQFLDADKRVTMVVRGNRMKNVGFRAVPFAQLEGGRKYEEFYVDVLQGPLTTDSDAIPTLSDGFEGFLTGVVPIPNLQNYPFHSVDIYLRDPGIAGADAVIPGILLGTFVEGSTQDSDPDAGEFRASLGAFTIPAGAEVVVQVTYSKASDGNEADTAITGPLSAPIPVPAHTAIIPGAPHLTIAKDAAGMALTWTADEGAFRLESRDSLIAGNWVPVIVSANQTAGVNKAIVSDGGSGRFYRLTQ